MHIMKVSSFLRSGAQLRKLYTASRQVLRLPDVSKNFELVTRTQIQRCAYGNNLVFQRNSSKVAAKLENGEEQSRIPNALQADGYVDHMMVKMENHIKHFGYITKKDVDSVFHSIKQSGSVSSIQGLHLIRCGTFLCYEPFIVRSVLISDIWSKLQELGVPTDASHYNALLKCYIENDHQFSPAEFLATMERKGVTPNRVTYQRVIEKYCCDGDLSGASAILEHMKEKGLPINENIFNSLVLGHARSKDMKGAANMLDIMRKSQLEPSVETYTMLACGFAENGDMEGFGNTLHEAEEKGLFFYGKNYLKMVSSLAVSGNLEHADEILMKVEFRECRSDAINTALGLINKGLDDAVHKVLQALSNANYNRLLYSFFKAFAVEENPTQRILEFCQKIYSEELYQYAYEDAAKAIVIHSKLENALQFFREMRKVGRPIRTHYFWPIFASLGKAGNTEGIWAAVKCISDVDLPIDTDTYVDYILPNIPTSDPKAVVSKIKELGQSDTAVPDALFLYYCSTDQLSTASDIYKEYNPQYSFMFFATSLSNISLSNVPSAVKLLKQMREAPDNDSSYHSYDICGDFLKYLLRWKRVNTLCGFIEEYNIQGIKLPTETVEDLSLHLRTVAPELVRLVQNLEINVIRDQHIDEDYVRPSQMTLEELEKRRVQVQETGGNIRPVLRHLLSSYCREKNLERALEIKAELDAINFTYSPASYALLVNLFVSHNNLDEAMKYKKLIDEEYPHFKLEAAKAINYVTLMVKNGRVDEALELIKNEAAEWPKPRYEDLLAKSIKYLLHAVADTGNVDLTQQLFETFAFNLKYLPLHHTSFEPLIKVHIIRNDNDAAIEEYRKCAVNYGIYPSRNFLFQRFITAKDSERLQKVVDISMTAGGKEFSLHELAAAFIESGCVPEARKVMQTLGAKADSKQLDIICLRFFKQNKVTELEQLIGITKDMFSVDRDQLYLYLLNLYDKNNDYQAALEMWNTMQEENVQPSVSTLQKLAVLLEKNNQPVPFVVPLHSDLQNTTNLMKCLEEKNEVEIVHILKGMKKGDIHSLSTETFIRIVDLLVEKKNLREIVHNVQVMNYILSKPGLILKPVANKYGHAGDVSSMKLLYDCFPDFTYRHMYFSANFFEAHIISGQEVELLNELEKNIEQGSHLFSPSGFLKVLQGRPDLLDRITAIADVYAEKQGFDLPKIVVWLHYLLQENYEVAEEMYKKCSDAILRTDFPFIHLIRTVQNTQDETMGRKLVELADRVVKIHIKSRAYSCLLDVLVRKEKHEEAVALIEEANKNGVPTEKLWKSPLRSLKQSLVERNMPVPFEVPSEDEDYDKSSSSDSD